MPKTRPYSREELQGLRRADLQRLCKTYDIKGANAKSEVLIDILAAYFVSPAYLASPRPDRSRPRPPPAATKVQSARALNPIPRRTATRIKGNTKITVTRPSTANPSLPLATSTTGGDAPAAPTEGQPGTPHALGADSQPPQPRAHAATNTRVSASTEPPMASASTAAGPSTSSATEADDLPTLRREVQRLQGVIATWHEDQGRTIERLVEDKVARALETTIAHQLVLVEQREASVKLREEQLDMAWKQLESRMRGAAPITQRDTLFVPTPSAREKRRHAGEDESEAGGSTSLAKRARLEFAMSPHTPPPTVPSLEADVRSSPHLGPHTPAHDTAELPGSGSRSASHSAKFATTPRAPTEPSSPTQGGRAAPPPILPPASRPRDLVAHKAYKAHIDLASITDETSPAFLGPILIRKDRAVSPPALSPSPSIGGDNYSYNTYAPVPGSSSSSTLGLSTKVPDGVRTPTRSQSRLSPSPRREYMDVALNGLPESPSTMATPNSRTMLGTERYRDNRFGDEPFVAWTSPTVDCGADTPSH